MPTDAQFREPAMEYLRGLGYDPEWVNAPVDIKATKDGREYWIEVKGTGREGNYFGAATLTEWMCAYENKESFYFLIANKPGINSAEYDESTSTTEWSFELVPPEVMMAYSSIPPFKVNFTLPLNASERSPPETRTALRPTWKILKDLNDTLESVRED